MTNTDPEKRKAWEYQYHRRPDVIEKNRVKARAWRVRNLAWARASEREYMKRYRQTHKGVERQKRKELRAKILAAFGGKCDRCGFADSRALQIDHVNGGGCKEIRLGHPIRYYSKVLRSIEGGEKIYQLLCANCNWIKRAENNEAPADQAVSG